MQDDLATLFSRNLTLANPVQPSLKCPQSLEQTAAGTVQPITYITQHYHHSAHVVPSTPSSSQAGIASPSSADIDQNSAEVILSQNEIDPTALFPSQLTLFRQADSDQQLRLIQLWRISPPSYGGHALAQELGNWPPTSLRQEEEMAQIRYERKLAQQSIAEEATTSNQVDPESKASFVSLQDGDGRPNAEPYILLGYETLAQRDYDAQSREQQQQNEMTVDCSNQQAPHEPHYDSATDPVYQGQQWWHNFVGNQMMEHQYGAFDQMNRFGHQPSGLVCAHGPEDEEML